MARLNVGRKSGFILRGGVSRRQTFWFSGLEVRSALAAASTAAVQTSLNAAALALRPFTIVRTRGVLFLRSDQEGASENQDIAYGNIVVSDQATAIGVTAVPTPATDSQSDWYVYERMINRFQLFTAVGFHPNAGMFMAFDSKAMRKVTEGEDVLTVVETDAISAGATVSSFARILIKLH